MATGSRLSLIDLMAAVGSAALGLACVVRLAPGRFGPALIVVGPLLGILWHRRRGGRGIVGGALGGAAYAVVGILLFFSGRAPGGASPSTMANWPPMLLAMTAICVTFGAASGLASWLIAASMGRPRAPRPPTSGWS